MTVVGDVTARIDWAQVWAEHGSAMLHAAAVMLRGRVADSRTAEDVVQAVLTERIKNPAGFANADNQRAYLIRAVQKRCLTFLERGQRQGPAADPDQVFDTAVADGTSVEEEYLELERQAVVAGFLDLLPEKQRIALTEVVMNGRSKVEVAPELGVTPQRVSQLVREAIERLQANEAFVSAMLDDNSIPDSNWERPT